MAIGNITRGTCAFALSFIALSSEAQAASIFDAWLDGARPLVDIRARYESVDDQSKAIGATADTLRARLGVQSGEWNGLTALVEMDGIWDINDAFNSTRNGRTAYAIVADPQMAALNRAELSYTSDYATSLVIGRQRILLGDQRFVGNAGWRQHEQTFDAATLANNSIAGLTLTYSYVDRVNRVYGPDLPVPATGPAGAYDCNCHLFNAEYAGVPGLKLDGFGYLLDLSQNHGPASARLATQKLSTATFGVEGSYSQAIAEDLSAQLLGEYAHQNPYGNNPLAFSLDYWRGEAGLTFASITGTVGYEELQGNGTLGFSTPLATTHLFDGWADLFLTTPVNGLADIYVQGAYPVTFLARDLHIDAVKASAAYRDFSTALTTGAGSTGLGTEVDAALEFDYDKAAVLLQYASYHGAGIGLGGFPDKSIAWLQVAYKY
ncbi:MAG TPA: hypothetical protein VKB67_07485 [Rhizomicrobium sp.]|nr:hypothetical protein [Rhizomicrobium sp.]